LQGHGLIASFYAGENWQGDPKLVWLDPFVGVRVHSELDEVARPFTATWSGFLDAPASGEYTFELEAADEGSLKIDGKTVPVTAGASATLPLTSGRHSIEVRLLNRRGGATAFLYWRTPLNREREVVPADRFFPR
jgi:MSHA biogenesis protein MshQ